MVDGKVTTITLPETREVTTKADEALAFAQEISIADDAAYKIVGEFVIGLKAMRAQIRSLFYDGANGEKDKGQIPPR